MLVKIQDILEFLQKTGRHARVEGSGDTEIMGFCSLNHPKSGCITWLKHAKEHSLDHFAGCSSCIVVAGRQIDNPIINGSFLVTEEPKAVFFSILEHFWKKEVNSGAALNTVVESVHIAPNVSIGHHCYIGKDVSIGSGTVIEHNVSIYNRVSIGKNCYIHAGAVIGTDGFGFFKGSGGRFEKVEHYGGVVIGDSVELGANAAVARGTIDDTIIGSHTKIDNLCHIAHNCIIGENVLITAQSTIAGSAILKDNVYIGPGGIVKNQITLEENAFVGIGGVAIKDVQRDTVAAGVPARPMRRVRDSDK